MGILGEMDIELGSLVKISVSGEMRSKVGEMRFTVFFFSEI